MPYKDKARQRDFQNRWTKQRRLDWIAANGPCAWCESDDRLEVDHKDRTQKVAHRIWTYTQSKRDVELAKCQVLCYECHKLKSASELYVVEVLPDSLLKFAQKNNGLPVEFR